jgi:plasmid stability protein
VRILIRNVHSCLFDSIEWIPKQSSLRAVEVYGPPEGQAKAFFAQDPPRRRIVAPGGETELRFRIVNASGAALSAEARLVLPAGLTAEPAAQKVELPADGGAECAFKVRLGAEAPEGLYTVLAGLWAGDALICADYAARVLCCRKPPPPKEEKGP